MARRPLKPAPSGGLPPVSATAVLWVNADQGTFTNTIGGTPATTTGATVGAWQDFSGSAHHFTAGSGGQMQAGTGPGGHNFVRFAGSSQYLQALFTLNQPFDIFLMMEQRSWVSGAIVLAGGSGDTFQLYQSSVTPSLTVYTGVGDIPNNTNLALNTWGLVEAGGSGTNSFTKVNNTTTVTGTALLSANRGGITLAAHPGPTSYGNIDVAELIVYNAVLSGTDATSVRAYFTGRYGIP